MSVPFHGCRTRSAGVYSAIKKELLRINLKAVKRITITFDPFAEKIEHTREFLHILSFPRVSATNPNCLLKTKVVCDRQPSEVTFSLVDQAQEILKVKEVRLLGNNLTTLELLQLCNKYITRLVPVEKKEEVVKKRARNPKLGIKRGFTP